MYDSFVVAYFIFAFLRRISVHAKSFIQVMSIYKRDEILCKQYVTVFIITSAREHCPKFKKEI